MDSAKIEHLISEAINDRPIGTNAPLNLYIHKSRLICGTRVAIPSGAAFVAYVTADRMRNGFDTREWKAIIERIQDLTETAQLQGAAVNRSENIKQVDPADIYQRRREQRLYYRRPILYTLDTNQSPYKAVMFDVASRGMAFTCSADKDFLSTGQDISTNFGIPRFNADDSLAIVNFDRIGRICRISEKNSLHYIAVQFANPLPFKPGEQAVEQSITTQRVEAVKI